MYIVSACLAGINCKYDGKNNLNKKIQELVKKGEAIPICPELLGGLTVPRTAAEMRGDKIFTKDGEDVTQTFVKGAEEVLRIAKMFSCKKAILKARSPSCGSGEIKTFSGKLIKNNGITAALLKKNGIKVYTEENFK